MSTIPIQQTADAALIVNNLKLANDGNFDSLTSEPIGFTINEKEQGSDLNGDGDKRDSILHTIEFLSDDKLFCDKSISEYDSIVNGTDDDDMLQGTKGNDLIFGMNGNDLIYGGNGNDCIHGGNGNDSIFGSGGNDVMFGDDGDDVLFGAMGNDILNGGLGDDHLIDDNGDDKLDGGDDSDLCFDKYGHNSFERCEVQNE